MKGYLVEVEWGWGRLSRFNETYRFHVDDPSEVDERVRDRIIPWIVRNYAFDCGRVDYPLNPYIYVIRLTPVGEPTYLPTDAYGPLLDDAVTAKRKELSVKEPS